MMQPSDPLPVMPYMPQMEAGKFENGNKVIPESMMQPSAMPYMPQMGHG